MRKASQKEQSFPKSETAPEFPVPPNADLDTPWTDATCNFLKTRTTFEFTDFEIWDNHSRRMERAARFWLEESIWQSEEKQRIHRLLMDADFWLAHLEDFTKGKAGDDITKLRAKIEKEMRPF